MKYYWLFHNLEIYMYKMYIRYIIRRKFLLILINKLASVQNKCWHLEMEITMEKNVIKKKLQGIHNVNIIHTREFYTAFGKIGLCVFKMYYCNQVVLEIMTVFVPRKPLLLAISIMRFNGHNESQGVRMRPRCN